MIDIEDKIYGENMAIQHHEENVSKGYMAVIFLLSGILLILGVSVSVLMNQQIDVLEIVFIIALLIVCELILVFILMVYVQAIKRAKLEIKHHLDNISNFQLNS